MTFQDPWIVGSRLYLTRKTENGTAKATVDLGVIQQVTPNIANTNITLDDPDGGVNRTVATASTSIAETYSVQTANCSLDNLSIALQGKAVEEVNQAATSATVTHEGSVGALVSLMSSEAGDRAYPVDGVSHVSRRTRLSELNVTDIDVDSNSVTFMNDHGLVVGDTFVITKYTPDVNGKALKDTTHAGEYEVLSVTDTKTVVITVASALELGASDEENVNVLAFESEAIAFTNLTVTDISVTDRLITFSTAHGLSAGDKVIVTNSTSESGGPEFNDPTNVGTYVVATAPSATTIEVTLASAAQFSNNSESNVGVDALVYTAGVEVFTFGVDYEEYNLDRGLVRLKPSSEGGSINVKGDIDIGIQLAALTGRREFKPQTGQIVEGELEIWFSRDGFSKETVRYSPLASLVLNSADFQIDSFSSLTFDITILSGSGSDSFGYMRQTKGEAQTLS